METTTAKVDNLKSFLEEKTKEVAREKEKT